MRILLVIPFTNRPIYVDLEIFFYSYIEMYAGRRMFPSFSIDFLMFENLRYRRIDDGEDKGKRESPIRWDEHETGCTKGNEELVRSTS